MCIKLSVIQFNVQFHFIFTLPANGFHSKKDKYSSVSKTLVFKPFYDGRERSDIYFSCLFSLLLHIRLKQKASPTVLH